ncbi:MAG: polyether ionophore transport system ATP-binding protein [Actinomycetota bacterium]|nr:polyether ionophore transport system ATP-binding protein [Actinomycetota bacterium]
MTTAISVTGLTKTFGRTRALDLLDLTVPAGQVHGFLGPNGAGKSTTLRILLGLVRPDGGNARVLGTDPWKNTVGLHRRLTYVPGDVHLWPGLTGGEALDLLTGLRGHTDRTRRDELIDRFQLDPTTRCRSYSKGNRQKVALIAALSCDVELHLLDEPTCGLDPLMEAVFQQVITELRHEGRTVLLSSHLLSEVETLCDQVTIVRGGRTVRTGTITGLRRLSRTAVTVHTALPVTGLPGVPGVHDVRTEGPRTDFTVEGPDLNHALTHLVAFDVRALTCAPPSLEEIFLHHYDRNSPIPSPAPCPAGAR